MSSKSIALRAFLALLLMFGFYAIAVLISGMLLYIPVAEWIYAKRIHLKLAFICIVCGLAILWSILPRFKKFVPPGPKLNPKDHPKLFAEIGDIARKVGQAMPEEVYLVNDINAWVGQRGGIFGIGSRRIMGIGLPLLQMLNISQFRAVLAHEFGHYYGGDTRLAPIVYRTRETIIRTINGLAEHSSILQMPFVWYGKLFLRVSHAVSRAQEFTADRLAAKTVGAEHIIEGLSLSHGAGLAFDTYWRSEVVPILSSGYKPPITDGFNDFMNTSSISSAVEKEINKEVRNEEASPYDTHPSLKQRIDAVKNFKCDSESTNRNKAITLIENVPELENQVLTVIAGGAKAQGLKQINWADVGTVVYVPYWESSIGEQTVALKDVTPRGLPNISRHMDEFLKVMKKDFDESIPLEVQAGNVIGMAIAFVLNKKGWAVNALPGENVALSSGALKIEPFAVLGRLQSGDLDAQEWIDFCENQGIADINLGKVAVGGLQREEQLVI